MEHENNENNEKCTICLSDFTNIKNYNCNEDVLKTDTIKLKCGHSFHYECILMAYNTNKFGNSIVTLCPYCRQMGGYLPLPENEKYQNGIHQTLYVERRNLDKFKTKHPHIYNYLETQDKCIGIMKSGKNCGKQCNKLLKKPNYTPGFCPKHKSYFNLLIKDDINKIKNINYKN